MIFNEERRIFEVENMKVDESFSFNLESSSNLIANNIIYEDGIVSKIQISKSTSRNPENVGFILIKLFIGNLVLGYIVSHEDYVLIKNSKTLEYTIRKAESYDYLEIKTNPLHRVHQ